jgi:hypothetical protein
MSGRKTRRASISEAASDAPVTAPLPSTQQPSAVGDVSATSQETSLQSNLGQDTSPPAVSAPPSTRNQIQLSEIDALPSEANGFEGTTAPVTSDEPLLPSASAPPLGPPAMAAGSQDNLIPMLQIAMVPGSVARTTENFNLGANSAVQEHLANLLANNPSSLLPVPSRSSVTNTCGS